MKWCPKKTSPPKRPTQRISALGWARKSPLSRTTARPLGHLALQFRNPDPWEDPQSRSPKSGLQYSYGVDVGSLRWIYFLDPPRGLGTQSFDVASLEQSIALGPEGGGRRRSFQGLRDRRKIIMIRVPILWFHRVPQQISRAFKPGLCSPCHSGPPPVGQLRSGQRLTGSKAGPSTSDGVLLQKSRNVPEIVGSSLIARDAGLRAMVYIIGKDHVLRSYHIILPRRHSYTHQTLMEIPAHMLYYTILYYTILYYTILYYTILYYTILYYTILYYTILYYTTLYYTILYYTILYYTILYYTILYYTILYYTILYYTILYYAILYYTILYYTILYYTILYYTILYCTILNCTIYYTMLYYTILYYTILYYTILYYTILYYTILYYTILYYTILYYTILYYTILYYTILYSTILYYTLLHSTLLYSTLLYSTLLYSTLLYSTLLYSTLLYSTLLYSTLLYSTTQYYTILAGPGAFGIFGLTAPVLCPLRVWLPCAARLVSQEGSGEEASAMENQQGAYVAHAVSAHRPPTHPKK